MEDFIGLFVSFVIILGIINLYKTKTSKVKYVRANLYNNDNNQYLCRINEGTIPNDRQHNSQAGANALSFMRTNLILLVKAVDKNYKNLSEKKLKEQGIQRAEIKMLIDRFDPDNISESTPTDKYTSYSVNKGEKIIFCIRDKRDFEIIDKNTLMFVAIHELAHVMTKSIGHGDDFWNNMRFLLKVAIETSCDTKQINRENDKNNYSKQNTIYKYVNYAENSSKYCGTEITTTPCKDDKCENR